MTIQKSFWVLLSVFIIAAIVLGSATQVTAETLKSKFFNKVTKAEGFPVPDAEGHWVTMFIREGMTVFENGELAWHKAVIIWDGIKETGTFTQHATTNFQDGSSFTAYTKGTSGSGKAEWTGELIHGTGRFQGIKGTATSTTKFLPPEKGEIAGKGVGESTLNFTLPPK